jgi:hypothetical protein
MILCVEDIRSSPLQIVPPLVVSFRTTSCISGLEAADGRQP